MRSPGKSASNRLMEKTGSSTYGLFVNVHFQLLEMAFFCTKSYFTKSTDDFSTHSISNTVNWISL